MINPNPLFQVLGPSRARDYDKQVCFVCKKVMKIYKYYKITKNNTTIYTADAYACSPECTDFYILSRM
jgi:hypothetical protein